MEAIWKGLADLGTVRYSRDRGEPDPIAFTPEQWEKFHARLLPLLEAGQTMRQNIGAYAVALNAQPFKQEDTMRAIRGCIDGLQAWDAALKPAA